MRNVKANREIVSGRGIKLLFLQYFSVFSPNFFSHLFISYYAKEAKKCLFCVHNSRGSYVTFICNIIIHAFFSKNIEE